MRRRASSAVQAGYSARRWTCAAFLPYRILAYSADCPIAAAASHFLRYRGPVRNEKRLPNGKLAVFLPCRIAENLAQRDGLLLAAYSPCSEPAQRCCAVVQTRPVPSVPCDTTFLRRRSADWYCAADFGLPLFLPYRAKQSHRDFAPTRCCAGWIPTGNVRPVPAAYSA